MINTIPSINFGRFSMLLSMPKSHAKAKAEGSKYYFTGKPCKRGHMSERRTNSGNCVACKVEYNTKYYEDNREAIAEQQAKYKVANREAIAAYNAKYQVANHGSIAEHRAKYHAENPGAANESTKWSNYFKLGSTMPWSDREAIQALYKRCREISERTGIQHHVDHIYPINGKIVSGLHVAANLQIITATENLRKHNKHPDQIMENIKNG